jgi:AcrR family transcriptional regulator
MPRIWADTIDTHRRQVTDAILDATAQLIVEQGPMSVAMSAIAERAGIGRATLYKYFPDVASILVAWHTRDFADHFQRLKALSELEHVTLNDVAEFVRTQRRQHAHHQSNELVGALAHTVAGFEHSVEDLIRDEVVGVLTELLRKLATSNQVRVDIDPTVLARWLFHAVHAPPDLDDRAVSQLLIDSLAPHSRTSPPESTGKSVLDEPPATRNRKGRHGAKH